MQLDAAIVGQTEYEEWYVDALLRIAVFVMYGNGFISMIYANGAATAKQVNSQRAGFRGLYGPSTVS